MLLHSLVGALANGLTLSLSSPLATLLRHLHHQCPRLLHLVQRLPQKLRLLNRDLAAQGVVAHLAPHPVRLVVPVHEVAVVVAALVVDAVDVALLEEALRLLTVVVLVVVVLRLHMVVGVFLLQIRPVAARLHQQQPAVLQLFMVRVTLSSTLC